MEFQFELAVEIEAEGVILAVTHGVPRSFRQEVVGNAGFSREKAQTPCRNGRAIWEIRVQAIPDARGEVLDIVAEGDKVVLVDRFGGTHRGEFLGRPGTGDRIEWMAIHVYTIRDGKVLEDAYMRDELAIVQQLGPVPSA
jgi:predicted ester cyclase